MEKKNYDDLIKKSPLLQKMQRGEEVVWINPDLCPFETGQSSCYRRFRKGQRRKSGTSGSTGRV